MCSTRHARAIELTRLHGSERCCEICRTCCLLDFTVIKAYLSPKMSATTSLTLECQYLWRNWSMKSSALGVATDVFRLQLIVRHVDE